MVDKGPAWESSDEAYMCLRDGERTLALRSAIRNAVSAGSRVLDVGAGTGILSLFAAEAGAAVVYAIEGDPVLATCLRDTVEANGYSQTIRVTQGDVREVEVPDAIDVVICELLDTGLISESLVPVLNDLRDRSCLASSVEVIPSAYETYLQAVRIIDEPFGFRICAPRHEWSFYSGKAWLDTDVHPYGPPQLVWSGTFASDEAIEVDVEARVLLPAEANALMITGRVELGGAGWFADFPSMNGPKILPLGSGGHGDDLRVCYQMGGGMESVRLG